MAKFKLSMLKTDFLKGAEAKKHLKLKLVSARG